MEEIIRLGRISVSGQIAQIGDRLSHGDESRIDGCQVRYTAENEKRRRVLMY